MCLHTVLLSPNRIVCLCLAYDGYLLVEKSVQEHDPFPLFMDMSTMCASPSREAEVTMNLPASPSMGDTSEGHIFFVDVCPTREFCCAT